MPEDDTFSGIDGVHGSITVQNLEVFPIAINVMDAAEDSLTSLRLNPRASQTLTAAQLGIAAPGSGVIVEADWYDYDQIARAGVCRPGTAWFIRGANADTTDTVALENPPVDIAAVKVTQFGTTYPAAAYNWSYKDGSLAIGWSPKDAAEPTAGSTYSVTYYADCPVPRIAGVEKHTTGTAGVVTGGNTDMVDGYSAVPYDDLVAAAGGGVALEGQSRWILPIVQTNNGWNTVVMITNVSGKNNSVNARFYEAFGQGVGGASEALLSGELLRPGETAIVDLTDDANFPDDTVGSVWVDATHAVVAAAFRVKPSTDMMLTNVAQPRTDSAAYSPRTKYAPLVFRDYNGWNTGINVANLSSNWNTVRITYYNYQGNVVGRGSLDIAPYGMEYIYEPADVDKGVAPLQISAAKIEGTYPLAAAIDEVKYLGGQDQGHAMSYPAAAPQAAGQMVDSDGTPVYDRYLYESVLALPLVQKGQLSNGQGDTSGINLFNPSSAPVNAMVQFLDSSGVPVAPTVLATDAENPFPFEMPAFAGGTIYTLNYSEMPSGFRGSAIVGVVCTTDDCSGPHGSLVGVSNNVSYAVSHDGAAVYNLTRVNPASFSFSMGFDIDPVEATSPVNDENGDPGNHTLTAYVWDQFDLPRAGAMVQFSIVDGPNAGLVPDAEIITDADGIAEFTYDYSANGALGIDEIEVWTDTNHNGVRDATEVQTAYMEWIAGAPQQISVDPETAVVPIDVRHHVTVTILDAFDNPVPGQQIYCEVTGANPTTAPIDAGLTDDDGQAVCDYIGGDPGEDTITASVDGTTLTAVATVVWLEGVHAVNVEEVPEGNPPVGDDVADVKFTITVQDGDATTPWNYGVILVINDHASFTACTTDPDDQALVLTFGNTNRVQPVDIFVCDGAAGDSFSVEFWWDIDNSGDVSAEDILIESQTIGIVEAELAGTTEADPTEIARPDGTAEITTTVLIAGTEFPVAGIPVCWIVTSTGGGDGTLSVLCAPTDESGVATTTLTGTVAGTATITAYLDIGGTGVPDDTNPPLGSVDVDIIDPV